MLYLSYFLKRSRDEYFAHLTAIRDEGKWEEWLAFFIDGVATTALEGAGVVREVTGKARNRVYRYDDYMKLFDEPAGVVAADETSS